MSNGGHDQPGDRLRIAERELEETEANEDYIVRQKG